MDSLDNIYVKYYVPFNHVVLRKEYIKKYAQNIQ